MSSSPKTSNVLYLAAFFAAALLIVNVFLVSPSRRTKALREELAEVQDQVAQAEAELDSLQHQPSEAAKDEERQNGASSSPIELLTKKLGPQGLIFKRLETSKDESGVISFSIDARGSFASVLQYLRNISAAPTPILILDMSLSPQDEEGKVLNLQISGQLATGGKDG